MANSVVLPAPFGPINPVIRPTATVSETAFTASKPPKRQDTRSTDSRGSAMSGLALGGTRDTPTACLDQPDQATRRESNDENENAAIDDETEAGRVAGYQLGALTDRLHHQCTKQRPKDGAGAADDGRQQRLD